MSEDSDMTTVEVWSVTEEEVEEARQRLDDDFSKASFYGIAVSRFIEDIARGEYPVES